MQLEAQHVFDAPPEAVIAAMFDARYAEFYVAHNPLIEAYEELWREQDGPLLRRRLRIQQRPTFDRLGPERVPPEWFELIEESAWDGATRTLQFEVVPSAPQVRQRLRNRGTSRFEQEGTGRTRRVTQTEIGLSDLPLVLRPFRAVGERLLVSQARKLLDLEAGILASWLARDTEDHPDLQPLTTE